MSKTKRKHKDEKRDGEHRVKDADKDLERGRTHQVGATTQSENTGPKDGGETSENAGV